MICARADMTERGALGRRRALAEVYDAALVCIDLELQFRELIPQSLLYRPQQPVMLR